MSQHGSHPWILCLVAGCTFASAFPIAVWAAPAVDPAQPGRLRLVVEFSATDLTFKQVAGYDLVGIEGGAFMDVVGEPMLPVRQVQIALPEGTRATRVRVSPEAVEDLDGSFEILPAQPPEPTSSGSAQLRVAPSPAVYETDGFYPASPVLSMHQADLAGQSLAIMELAPVRYAPARKALTLLRTLILEIEYRAGYVCGDYLPESATEQTRAEYVRELQAGVLNPADVRVETSPFPTGSRSLEPGTYDYVIISPSDFVSTFEPLADWKTQKGVPARIVTTTWIYNQGGYSGTNEERIRAFIADAHATWGATFFLLGGDTNKIPCGWWPTQIEPFNIPNDTYFADYDGDFIVEVHLGRVPARYSSYAYTFVDKTLTYERNPARTGYGRRALLLGFDLDESSPGEATKEYIEDQYWPAGWDVTRVYDSPIGTHKVAALNAINAGQNLINHIDHCSSGELGVGDFNHGESIDMSDIAGLTNADRLSLMYTTGCFPAAFDEGTCIAEQFVVIADRGGYAFVGNTRYGWYNPGVMHTLSNLYDEKFFEALFAGGHDRLGDCFTAHKNSFYPVGENYQYIFMELTLLGDPELPLWSADPESLIVAHSGTMPLGPSAFTVQVSAAGGGGLSGARVCLWKEGEVYLTGLTGGDGRVTLVPSPTTEGSLTVTVTRPNGLPQESVVLVQAGSSAAPEPTAAPHVLALRSMPMFLVNAELVYDLPHAAAVDLTIYDLCGRQVRSLVAKSALPAGTQRSTWDGRDDAGRPVGAGVYLARLQTGFGHVQCRLLRLR